MQKEGRIKRDDFNSIWHQTQGASVSAYMFSRIAVTSAARMKGFEALF